MFYLFLPQHNFWWHRMNEQIIWNVNVERYGHVKRIELLGRVEHKDVADWSKCRTILELDKKIWGSLGGVLPNMMWKVLAFPKMMHRFRSNTDTHTNQCNVNFTCERITHSHKFLPLSLHCSSDFFSICWKIFFTNMNVFRKTFSIIKYETSIGGCLPRELCLVRSWES